MVVGGVWWRLAGIHRGASRCCDVAIVSAAVVVLLLFLWLLLLLFASVPASAVARLLILLLLLSSRRRLLCNCFLVLLPLFLSPGALGRDLLQRHVRLRAWSVLCRVSAEECGELPR